MPENIGKLDSFIRITAGLFLFGLGISKKSKILMFIGAQKTAEGITKFCPLLYLLKISTKEGIINKSNKKEIEIDFNPT